MRTKLEKHLNHLAAPPVPQNLKARCLSTIPLEGAPRKITLRKPALLMRPVAVAGTLMFAAVVGIAFWSTRPSSDGVTRSSGSVAFAQVLENARQIPFFHAKGYSVSPDSSGNRLKSEFWYDASQGYYSQAVQDSMSGSATNGEALPREESHLSRMLVLPDGTVYYRDETATVYVKTHPNNWTAATGTFLRILSGNAAGTKDLSGAGFGQVLSSTAGNWKGQKAQLLTLERQPSAKDVARNRSRMEAHLYVNPDTKSVIAFQGFAKSEDDLKLISEFEFDYSSPNVTLFDPKNIEAGAKIVKLADNQQPGS